MGITCPPGLISISGLDHLRVNQIWVVSFWHEFTRIKRIRRIFQGKELGIFAQIERSDFNGLHGFF
jgi:hypothetical protein